MVVFHSYVNVHQRVERVQPFGPIPIDLYFLQQTRHGHYGLLKELYHFIWRMLKTQPMGT
jgi:hypothetical protein